MENKTITKLTADRDKYLNQALFYQEKCIELQEENRTLRKMISGVNQTTPKLYVLKGGLNG